MNIKICPKCGTANDPSFISCKRCLSSLESAEFLSGKEAEDYISQGAEGAAAHVAKKQEELQIQESIIKEALYSFKVTTGYNFEKYSIEKYIDVISAEVVLGTGFLSEFSAAFTDFFGSRSLAFEAKVGSARSAAMKKLKAKAISLGSNAIIGIDYDYTIFGTNIISIIATGTAVYIEPIKEK